MSEFQLVSQALNARSQGDVQTARLILLELRRRNPANPQYERLLSELGNSAFAQPSPPPSFPTPVPEATPSSTVQDLLGVNQPAQPPALTPGGDPVEQPEGSALPTLIPGEGAAPVATLPAPVGDGDLSLPSLDDFDFDSIDKVGAKELKNKLKKAREDLKQAIRLRKNAEFAESNVLLGEIKQQLEATGGEEAAKILEDVNYELGHMLLYKAADDMDKGLFEVSSKALLDYEKKEGGPTKDSLALRKRLTRYQQDPYRLSIDKVSPNFIAEQADLSNLLIRARTQIVNGDLDGALETYREIELRYPNSPEAKYYQTLIAQQLLEISKMDRERTKKLMLSTISAGWAMPQVISRQLEAGEGLDQGDNPVVQKLKSITIPKITLSNVNLTYAINFLSDASVRFDFGDTEPKGVNIIPVFDPNDEDPRVNLNARNMTLERVLETLCDQVGYEFTPQEDVVTISKSQVDAGNRSFQTEEFTISRNTVNKLTQGAGAGGGGGGGAPGDPFAPAPGGGLGAGGANPEQDAIKDFMIKAGIPIADDTGFFFDGTKLIVHNSPRIIQRIRDLLRRYDDENTQVEIEAKFLEVRQGDLEELGFDWSVNWGKGYPTFDKDLEPILDSRGEAIMDYDTAFISGTRNLSQAFSYAGNDSKTTITRTGEEPLEFANPPPSLPNTLDLASTSKEFFKSLGKSTSILGGPEVNLLIRALQRQSGTELLSAPKVTVNDGGTANITVAQEFRYPENYDPGEISQNGSGFTGAVPNSFTERNVGVELAVTPQVANDTITLHLEPTVTEFEGFVEYGGNSVVIGGGQQQGNFGGGGGGFGGGQGFGGFGGGEQVVIVQPSGIYQPIFSVRRVVTDVSIYDGATVLIGGLTREEVKTVKDKVPILGNIPGLGRLFRSEGESSLKRNLIIFVTGNIISPGGGLKRQDLATIKRGSVFQNPIVITPAGPERRLDARLRLSN